MNERIKKLLKQATKEVDPHDRVWVFSKVDQAKFAELIVRECADIGERYADGNYEIRNQILIHFGLEEPEE
jgi:hypothetical protein